MGDRFFRSIVYSMLVLRGSFAQPLSFLARRIMRGESKPKDDP